MWYSVRYENKSNELLTAFLANLRITPYSAHHHPKLTLFRTEFIHSPELLSNRALVYRPKNAGKMLESGKNSVTILQLNLNFIRVAV